MFVHCVTSIYIRETIFHLSMYKRIKDWDTKGKEGWDMEGNREAPDSLLFLLLDS